MATVITLTGSDVETLPAALTFNVTSGPVHGVLSGTATIVQRLLFDVRVHRNPLILLAPALAMRVHSGGAIVLSGILATQADEVQSTYSRWFRIAVAQAQEGWVTLAGERTER